MMPLGEMENDENQTIFQNPDGYSSAGGLLYLLGGSAPDAKGGSRGREDRGVVHRP